jgi:hypothetical protein
MSWIYIYYLDEILHLKGKIIAAYFFGRRFIYLGVVLLSGAPSVFVKFPASYILWYVQLIGT